MFWMYFLITCIMLFLILVLWLKFGCSKTILDDATLTKDLQSIGKVYDIDQVLRKEFVSQDVEVYYSDTMNKDYWLLEAILGPGMHTRLMLKHPIIHHAGHTSQVAYVMSEIVASKARNVLEVGFGKGYCTFYLANMLPHCQFHGIDLVQRHVYTAQMACDKGGYHNVTFHKGDATVFTPHNPNKYDLVFGVESLCHMDTIAKIQMFFKNMAGIINPQGGKLVIIDGFRSFHYDKATQDQQTAMQLTEKGFKINRMFSKMDWVHYAIEAGFHVTEDIDLTHEALPFWTTGWKLARWVFQYLPCLVRRWKDTPTASNLLSIATVAHALQNKATAEYGILIFQLQKG